MSWSICNHEAPPLCMHWAENKSGKVTHGVVTPRTRCADEGYMATTSPTADEKVAGLTQATC